MCGDMPVVPAIFLSLGAQEVLWTTQAGADALRYLYFGTGIEPASNTTNGSAPVETPVVADQLGAMAADHSKTDWTKETLSVVVVGASGRSWSCLRHLYKPSQLFHTVAVELQGLLAGEALRKASQLFYT